MSKLPGITRQDEEQHLKRMIHIAEQNLARTQGDVQALAEELKNLLEKMVLTKKERKDRKQSPQQKQNPQQEKKKQSASRKKQSAVNKKK